MLDARYVHLHEALGLGAMWLKNTAKIIVSTDVLSTSGSLNKRHSSKSAVRQDNAAHQQMVAWLQQNRPVDDLPKQSTPKSLLQPPLATIFSGSISPASVLVLALEASPNDFVKQQLFSGEEGVLLYKMLAAINLQSKDVHLSCWLKTQRSLTIPTGEEILQASQLVAQEWQQTQAKAMLLLGDIFYRQDLQEQIKKIVGDAPVFIVPHPYKILMDKSLKRPAWNVLQQLQAYLQS